MKYAFVNGFVLSGHEDMMPENKVVFVEGEKIVAIKDAGADTTGYEVVDLNGQYIMPGLINMHVHIPASGKPKKGKTNYNAIASLLKFGVVRAVVKSMCESYAKDELLSGTTTIRAVGGVMDFDTWLRDKINAGKAVGPRILAANYAVSVPGGHMTGSVALPVNSADEAAKMVEDLSKTKPDLIKLMITGGVLDAEVPGEPGVLKMPAEYVKAACDKAHELGFKVAAHVESTEGMVVALENGVDTIEHGGHSSEKTTALFKEKGAVLISTISPAVPFAVMDQAITGLTETDLINGKALFENIIDGANAALAAGIPVGLGTDTGCPFITHYDMWRELFYYTKYCHVSNAFALYSATLLNAKIAGIDNETGSVDVGKSADLIVTKENPLENIKTLRNVTKVVFKGDIIDNPNVKKMPFVEECLDAVMAMIE
ncbi:MAG: amidohydrolase family protein [Bacillota bacterium]|nr:amidohydrolase family protein [Bacillota bacterium]